MKTKSIVLLAFILLVSLLFQNCTLEKRRYSSGFHIEWNTASRHILDARVPDDAAGTVSETVSFTEDLPDTLAQVLPVTHLKMDAQNPGSAEHSQHRTRREIKSRLEPNRLISAPDLLNKNCKLEHSVECITKNVNGNISLAADASMGLSRVSLITSVGWILVLSQNINAIAIGAIVLGIGSACALLAIILALIIISKYKRKESSEEEVQMARKGIRNSLLFLLVGIIGLIGCAFVFGWL